MMTDFGTPGAEDEDGEADMINTRTQAAENEQRCKAKAKVTSAKSSLHSWAPV